MYYSDQPMTQLSDLLTVRKRRRSQPTDYLFGAKSFVDPRRCLSVFNHYCWVRSAGLETGLPDLGVSIDVDVSVALSHHYRQQCPFNEAACRFYDRQSVIDDVMLKFREQLDRRVGQAIRDSATVSDEPLLTSRIRRMKRVRRHRRRRRAKLRIVQ